MMRRCCRNCDSYQQCSVNPPASLSREYGDLGKYSCANSKARIKGVPCAFIGEEVLLAFRDGRTIWLNSEDKEKISQVVKNT